MLAAIIWFMSQCELIGRKKISPHLSPKKWSIYGVTCIVTIHALGSYATTAFFLRSWENVMENWRAHYFWGHIACFLYYIIVSMLPTPQSQASTMKPELSSNSMRESIVVVDPLSKVGDTAVLIEEEKGDAYASKRKYS